MMAVVMAGKSMTGECFVQVLNNLSGYSIQHHMIEDTRFSWTDQRNLLDHMHNLEKKMFEAMYLMMS